MRHFVLGVAVAVAGLVGSAQAQAPQCAEAASLWARLRTSGTAAELRALLAVTPPACAFERAAAQERLKELAGKPAVAAPAAAKPSAAAKPPAGSAATQMLAQTPKPTAAAKPAFARGAIVQVGKRELALPAVWTKELVVSQRGAYAALYRAQREDAETDYQAVLSAYNAQPITLDASGNPTPSPPRPPAPTVAEGYYIVGQSYQAGGSGVGALLKRADGGFTVVAGHTFCGAATPDPPLDLLTYLGPTAKPRHAALAEEFWLANKSDADAIYGVPIIDGIAKAPDPKVTPLVLKKPNGRDVERFYPPRALYREKSGKATLRCAVRYGGDAACIVASENPTGWGFGEAAINISKSFLLALPESAGKDAIACIPIPVNFTLP